MEINTIPKIPDSIGVKQFYFQLYLRKYNWLDGIVLIKKEVSGKYIELKPIIIVIMPYTTPHTTLYEDEAKIFECEINQEDVNKMHNQIISGKVKNYIPDLYIKKKNKLYYPYIVSISKNDITNNKKKIISLQYEYKLDKLIGFHPFTPNKNPPESFYVKNGIGNFLAKFYNLYKDEIDIDKLENIFSQIFLKRESFIDIYDDLEYLTVFFEIEIKKNNIEQIKKLIKKMEFFKWGYHNKWTKYNPKNYNNFYENVIKVLFLENSKNEKEIYISLEKKEKYILDKLFITYDFKNNYKYLNDENLLSSKLTTYEKKQDFYELYYDLLIDNNIYLKNFKYKSYFSEEFKNNFLEKYLRLEFNNMSYKTFDFASEDRYDTYESHCLIRKKYHTTSFSFRKTKNGELLYTEDEIKLNDFFSPYPKITKYFYLNKKILNFPNFNNINSTCSLNDEQIIITNGSNKPFIYNIKENNHPTITFDYFKESCFDAIKLNISLIIVSGKECFGYYSEVSENNYKIIKIYEPEEKKLNLIYLIEFNDNLLITCFVDFELTKNNENSLFEKNVYIGFHKINFNEKEKVINDENKLIKYDDIILNKSCVRYKNILVKLSNSILCIGGNNDLYLINIENNNLVKTINILSNNYIFCSFYPGDYNTLFISYRNRKIIQTYDEEFYVYNIDFTCYQFQENSLELKHLNRPSKKSREKDNFCIIF